MILCPRCHNAYVPVPETGATSYYYICWNCWDRMDAEKLRRRKPPAEGAADGD